MLGNRKTKVNKIAVMIKVPNHPAQNFPHFVFLGFSALITKGNDKNIAPTMKLMFTIRSFCVSVSIVSILNI